MDKLARIVWFNGIYFDPSKKYGKSNDIVELDLPVSEKLEVSKIIFVFQ